MQTRGAKQENINNQQLVGEHYNNRLFFTKEINLCLIEIKKMLVSIDAKMNDTLDANSFILQEKYKNEIMNYAHTIP